MLCAHAGKAGRQRKKSRPDAPPPPALVGATLCWLVDTPLNTLIGRLERSGAVKKIEQYMHHNDTARQYDEQKLDIEGHDSLTMTHKYSKEIMQGHLQAHKDYVDIIVPRLPTKEMQDSFRTRFVQDQIISAESEVAVEELSSVYDSNSSPIKYGNGATTVPTAVKCLHALVAAALAGVNQPVGIAVVNYIKWVATECQLRQSTNTMFSEAVMVDNFDVFFYWMEHIAGSDAFAATQRPRSSAKASEQMSTDIGNEKNTCAFEHVCLAADSILACPALLIPNTKKMRTKHHRDYDEPSDAKKRSRHKKHRIN